MKRRHGKSILVTGGCRSGKSSFAQRWAESRGDRRLFVATARVTDAEMAERIERHRAARGEGWSTVEEPFDLSQVISRSGPSMDVLLLDCVTVWLSNLMCEGFSDELIISRVQQVLVQVKQVSCSIAMVTNEVGWGVVPDYPLGRRFRDLAGAVNQHLAQSVEQVILMVAGVALKIKGTESL